MVVLGTDVASRRQVELSPQARRQGVYVIGTTGTGKTTLLKNIAYQDMHAGEGLCVLDPHGDLIDELLELVPSGREQDVILFAPGDDEQINRPLGLNLLDCNRNDPREARRVTSTVIDTLRKLFWYSWGPRMEDLLRNSLWTLIAQPETTLLDLWLLLASPKHRAYYTRDLADPYLQQFWGVQFAGYNQREVVEIVGSSLNKIGRFLADPQIRNVVSQPRTAFKLRSIMDEQKILLVNLSKGDLGEDNSALLGAVLVNLILIAALTRRDTPPRARRQFHLIVDEYQSFATESFPTLQSEARKYGIDVIVAHQYRDQLDELNKGSTLNVANFIVLRTSGIDSFSLASQFDNTPPAPQKKKQPVYREQGVSTDGRPLYTARQLASGAGTLYHEVVEAPRLYSDMQAERANQLSGLDDLTAQCRIVVSRKLTEYTIAIPFLNETESVERANAIRRNSLKRGTTRAEVEAFISKRIGEGLTFDNLKAVVEESEE